MSYTGEHLEPWNQYRALLSLEHELTEVQKVMGTRKKNSFTEMVVKHCKRLPRGAVGSPSLDKIQTLLHTILDICSSPS